ncbi:hypothetical protein NCHU2750_33510 [Neorhizobium sp. NCHU2750]|nr:hypothetical protein NCHU2750_33510 [Neorhizobium sp. NCHU2750]
MAASSRTGTSKAIWWIAGTVVVVIALYTAGWFYTASILREKTLLLLGSRSDAGISASCDDAEYRGFPFQIGLYCTRVDVDDNVNGISASFGALRSWTHVYNPKHIFWELDSPSEIRTSNGLTVSTSWLLLKSNLITKLKGIERSTMTLEKPKTTIVSSATGQTFDIAADQAEIKLRQDGADLNASIALENATTTAKGLPQLLPPTTTSISVNFENRAGVLDGSDRGGLALRGSQGRLREFKADLGQGQVLTLSGPFSFDDQGRMSGKLKLRMEDIPAWQKSLTAAFPDLQSTIGTAANMLQALGGGSKASLDITIRRGKVFAGGLIPIGEIPPV